MPFVVAQRRPGSKPSLLDSMPAGLLGKFSPNGGPAVKESKAAVKHEPTPVTGRAKKATKTSAKKRAPAKKKKGPRK